MQKATQKKITIYGPHMDKTINGTIHMDLEISQ